MAKKKEPIEEIEIVENIHNETMEEIMSSRYATYAKYVIQDRAIPDARDGLKPVQRRIIYGMYKEGNIFSRPTRKCAHAVGNVMAKYHPHGDTSIYDALVRMSQDWKNNNPLIYFQGNNGSIDGDGPAAYRYTEAKLSQIAEEMVRDLEKNTVDMSPNFDDSEKEPVVMPSRFPNLLVNGSEGIAVALATEIPTHNLREVIDAIIYRISHVRVEPKDLMQFVKGPDFPTGASIYNSKGLEEMYETGRGRIEIVSKTQVIDNGKTKQIVITEIPYKTIKKTLVYEIDMLRHNKVLPGIEEVRDESDRNGLRITIDVKKDANIDVIHKYLLTKSSLKQSYSANMVAIVNGSPKTMNLLDFVDAYINHQVDVITRKTQFDLDKSNSRLLVVNGLIKAISIVDEVVAVIRGSKDKQDAKLNLQKKFGFTEEQSEAIVMLQLYKLTNTDISVLEAEKRELDKNILTYQGILSDRKKLDRLLCSDLRAIATKYGTDRKTQIIEKGETKAIDKRDLINKEEVMLSVSRDGYIKYSSIKSYRSSNGNSLPGMKEGDVCIYAGQVMTTDYVVSFTNLGNFICMPVHEITEAKWKDEGKHFNSYISGLNPNEKIVRVYAIEKFREDLFFVLASKNGQIKRLRLSDLYFIKYSKPFICMKLLQDDELKDVVFTSGNSTLVLFSTDGRSVAYNENELPNDASRKSGGVKAFAQLGKAKIAGVLAYEQGETIGKAVLITNKSYARVYNVDKTPIGERLSKPVVVYTCFKSDEHILTYVKKLDTSLESNTIRMLTNLKQPQEIVISDYHQSDEKNAKQNIDISPKLRLLIPFIEGNDRILDSFVSYEIKREEKPAEISTEKEDEKLLKEEEKLEQEAKAGYKEISIFDDED